MDVDAGHAAATETSAVVVVPEPVNESVVLLIAAVVGDDVGIPC